MSDHAAVQRQLATWFLESLHLEIPSRDTDLIEAGVLDSLGFVELVLHLEKEFGVKITLEQVEIDTFRSIARIAAFVLQEGGAPQLAGRTPFAR